MYSIILKLYIIQWKERGHVSQRKGGPLQRTLGKQTTVLLLKYDSLKLTCWFLPACQDNEVQVTKEMMKTELPEVPWYLIQLVQRSWLGKQMSWTTLMYPDPVYCRTHLRNFKTHPLPKLELLKKECAMCYFDLFLSWVSEFFQQALLQCIKFTSNTSVQFWMYNLICTAMIFILWYYQ